MNQRTLRERYGISERAQRRHRAHIVGGLARAREAAEVARGDALLAQLQTLESETRAILERARGNDDERAMRAIARLERQTELAAKIAGAIREGTTIHVGDVVNVASAVLAALEDFPDAREAVARKFAELTNAVH